MKLKFTLVTFLLLNVFLFESIAWSKTQAENLDELQAPELIPEPKHGYVSQIIARSLAQRHFKKTYLDNDVSEQLLEQFLDTLDGSKSYFLASDIDSFYKKYRIKLDDAVLAGNVNEAYEIHRTFMTRWIERYDFAEAQLTKKFDFSRDEAFHFDRENANWIKTKAELDDFWRQRVKNDVLNLKLAGKEQDEIVDLLTKRYRYAKRRMMQTKSEDVFSFYMNSLLQLVEPHTSYMSPRQAENFNIDMSLKLQGIGAVLQTDDVYTKVVSLVPQGPADKSKQIDKEDKIIAVGQGKKDMVDIVGWRLDDVVDLIRGEKGSTVRLEIIPKTSGADADTKVVTLVRDEIKLEEGAAKSEIIEVKRDGAMKKFGLITLPKFYIDTEAYHKNEEDYRSTTRDMRKILEDFIEKKVDGVVIDLRNNGGGFLQEAIQSTGLFIKEGPIVQDKNVLGQVKVHRDYDPGIVYTGPLMVVVNSLSASASEIFAGAIQDYGRGIVVGSQTYGKGTVQNVMNLNQRMLLPMDDLGQLKFTVSKFYRVSGDSTQHKGVIPDVKLPDLYQRDEVGESSRKNALPWDQIKPVNFRRFSNIDPYVSDLQGMHQKRVEEDQDFKLLLEEISEYQTLSNRTKITLNEKQRLAERDAADERRLNRINLRRKVQGEKPLKSLDDLEDGPDEEDDVIKDEYIQIMADYVALRDKSLVVSADTDRVK